MGGAGAGSEPVPLGEVHGWPWGGASLEVKEDLPGVTREKGGGSPAGRPIFRVRRWPRALVLLGLGSLASLGSPHTGCRLRGIGGQGAPIIIAIVTSAPGGTFSRSLALPCMNPLNPFTIPYEGVSGSPSADGEMETRELVTQLAPVGAGSKCSQAHCGDATPRSLPVQRFCHSSSDPILGGEMEAQ